MTKTNSASTKTISFHAYHRPAVPAGHYTAKASLVATEPVTASFESHELTFYVAGPRFQLSPKEIHTVFPPRASLGAHDNVLPHIVLERGTLPWERPSGHDDPDVPWLGLVLLQEEELADASQVEVSSMAWTDLRDELHLSPEPGDEPDPGDKPFPKVTVLELSMELFETVMPNAHDLRWLSHVRSVGPTGQGVERAVLVCNRLPKPAARAQVHLVSFEDRYASDGSLDPTNGIHGGKVRLLSLHSWPFACSDIEEFRLGAKAIARIDAQDVTVLQGASISEVDQETLVQGKEAFLAFLTKRNATLPAAEADKSSLLAACRVPRETFKGLMDELDLGTFRVAPRLEGAAADLIEKAEPYFESGGLPVAHGLRQGGKTASWYHGPFTAATELARGLPTETPVRNADQLLLRDVDTGMLDISYAAAWELGRLLSVGQPKIGQEIARWKAANARAAANLEQHGFFSHIPFTDRSAAGEAGSADRGLESYFESLSLLEGVPFHYLVPSEQFLPMESLRFFKVDPAWIEALLDGAFSIGRHTTLDLSREQGAGSHPLRGAQSAVSGILLRSDLVSGWPTLQVDGYSDRQLENRLEPCRFDRLGPDVLLVLFDRLVQGLAVHLPSEGLHFGFDRGEGGEDYFKVPKSLTSGATERVSVPIRWRVSWPSGSDDVGRSRRVFDPHTFVDNFRSANADFPNPEDFPSGAFAIEMLQGVPRLEVRLHPAAAECDLVASSRSTRGVAVRERPTSSSPLLGRLQPGEPVTCLGSVPHWHEILFHNGQHGYVHKGWTEPV